jgi:hypothetical protein
MKSFDPRPTLPAFLLLAIPGSAGLGGAGEQREAPAEEVWARMEKVYAACRTYRDTGTVRTEDLSPGGKKEEERASFTTAFVRPGPFQVLLQFGSRDHGSSPGGVSLPAHVRG